MKRLINSFSKNQMSNQEAKNIKGGTIFCEWYVSYAGAANVDPSIMATAMALDTIVAKYGVETAMSEGGSAFMASFTSNGNGGGGTN